jgi:hypothetical protein
MIFIKIVIKNKFPKATCNHPPFNNCNSIDSKLSHFLPHHRLLLIPKTLAWLGDFLTYANWNNSICKWPSL